MKTKRIDDKEELKELIQANNKKEVERNRLLESLGNPDVFCDDINREIGIVLFNYIVKVSEKCGDKEMITNKLMLRSFIDTEVNCINDMLQSKSYELLRAIYFPIREQYLKGNPDYQDSTILLLDIETKINKFLSADCKMLKIYYNMPLREIVKKLNENKISEKRALNAVKKVINKGMGVSSVKAERSASLKHLENAVSNLNMTITR